MRYLRQSFGIAALLAAFGIAQAVVGARELERVPPTTRMPNLPLSNLLASAGLALMVVLYGALGRAMARSGIKATTAAARGALAGFVAGLVAGIAQALLQADVLLTYSLSDAFLGAVLGAVIVLEPLAGAAAGAIFTWLAYLLFRPIRRAGTA